MITLLIVPTYSVALPLVTQWKKQTIEFHIEGLKKEKTAIPEPSTEATSIEVAA